MPHNLSLVYTVTPSRINNRVGFVHVPVLFLFLRRWEFGSGF